mmetsp:Transcript_4844/g.9057  ORF Transcript_4844/g.9057 Transcript_4844/m.9057 type:complete len:121 (+) Transcript_4844:880-1242(+)
MEISPLACFEELLDPVLLHNARLEEDGFALALLPNLVYRNDAKLKLVDDSKTRVVATGLLQRAVMHDTVKITQRLLVVCPSQDTASLTEHLFKALAKGLPETRTALLAENSPIKCQVSST